ncbi:YciI family protein [Psychrobacter frigidicola]|uniref:YciI family protein n=1 Tax=Psychrobacter frigidicola TaxID=45611 RepID=A0A5C7A782_9GAMM|nr:YciI family protein [Psychrobacter frigidicola]TXD98520.1 YciI family protein [Psychrobacter frigidicola]
MLLFAIIGHDVANSSAQRKITRTEHLARLQALDAEQRLLIAGPTPITHSGSDSNSAVIEMSGSIVIAQFESLEAAQTWASAEPYLRDGVYSHVDIKPFIHVLPKPTDKIEAS